MSLKKKITSSAKAVFLGTGFVTSAVLTGCGRDNKSTLVSEEISSVNDDITDVMEYINITTSDNDNEFSDFLKEKLSEKLVDFLSDIAKDGEDFPTLVIDFSRGIGENYDASIDNYRIINKMKINIEIIDAQVRKDIVANLIKYLEKNKNDLKLGEICEYNISFVNCDLDDLTFKDTFSDNYSNYLEEESCINIIDILDCRGTIDCLDLDCYKLNMNNFEGSVKEEKKYGLASSLKNLQIYTDEYNETLDEILRNRFLDWHGLNDCNIVNVFYYDNANNVNRDGEIDEVATGCIYIVQNAGVIYIYDTFIGDIRNNEYDNFNSFKEKVMKRLKSNGKEIKDYNSYDGNDEVDKHIHLLLGNDSLFEVAGLKELLRQFLGNVSAVKDRKKDVYVSLKEVVDYGFDGMDNSYTVCNIKLCGIKLLRNDLLNLLSRLEAYNLNLGMNNCKYRICIEDAEVYNTKFADSGLDFVVDDISFKNTIGDIDLSNSNTNQINIINSSLKNSRNNFKEMYTTGVNIDNSSLKKSTTSALIGELIKSNISIVPTFYNIGESGHINGLVSYDDEHFKINVESYLQDDSQLEEREEFREFSSLMGNLFDKLLSNDKTLLGVYDSLVNDSYNEEILVCRKLKK